MGINDIEFTPQVVADLYPDSLIGEAGKVQAAAIIPEEKSNADAENDTGLKWLGNNEQRVLIVVNNPETTYLPDKQLTFLTGILTACRLSIADVAIVNMGKQTAFTYKDAASGLQSKNVILFGISPDAFGLPMSFPQYQLQAFTGVTYLAAPALPLLENDKAEKGKLWLSLKKMFGI
jgi:hypothetical protein